jgi:hypothetical protein
LVVFMVIVKSKSNEGEESACRLSSVSRLSTLPSLMLGLARRGM